MFVLKNAIKEMCRFWDCCVACRSRNRIWCFLGSLSQIGKFQCCTDSGIKKSTSHEMLLYEVGAEGFEPRPSACKADALNQLS